MRGVWTRERIVLLKKLWKAGETATAIAKELRMSRSAVLGKVFRLRLRPAANAAAAVARRHTAAIGRRRRGRPRVKLPSTPEVPTKSPAKTLLELTNDCCRWPVAVPRKKGIYFCGAPEADLEGGRPYCERHMRRAYVNHKKATAPRAGAAGSPLRIPSPSIVPPGVKRQRLVFSHLGKRS